MANRRFPSLFLLIISCSILSSYAFQFKVGGRQGWVVNPFENYNHWAERTRFQVNDTLFFKYQKGLDSVLIVSRDDYEKCNTSNPIVKLEDGDSIFKFDRSGPFFFISGIKANCDRGEKLIVVVLAVRRKQPPLAPAPITPAPSPTAPAPSLKAPTPSPITPAPSPTAPAPSPKVPTPSPTAPAPSPKAPTPSPRSGARPAFTASVVFMSAVSLAISMTLGVFIK